MKTYSKSAILAAACLLVLAGCSPKEQTELVHSVFEPHEIIDLGALVTEDLPERVFGKALLAALGNTRPNSFEVINFELEKETGTVSGSNAYYTLFNHGGPHVDAPNHLELGRGVDSYPIEAFMGPLKVFDVRRFPKGRSVPPEVFEGSVGSGEVVLIFTGYTPPPTDEAFPETIALTREAAEYLAEIPVRAFGTDAFSVGNLDAGPIEAKTGTARALPIHHSFLSRGIPIYEQLFNADQLLGKEKLYFVGVPLNIRDGDGMIVRPVVFVY